MRPKTGGLTVPAEGAHELVPGGDHLMLMDLTQPLQPGAEVALTVVFEDGSELPVTAQVRDFAGGNEEYQPRRVGEGPRPWLTAGPNGQPAAPPHRGRRRDGRHGHAHPVRCRRIRSPHRGFGTDTEPFHGAHQGGVTTVPQAHALFVALDLTTDGDRSPRDTLTAILKLWSADAARLTQGVPALADTEPELAQRPARLTVTVGLGPTVFDRDRAGRSTAGVVADLPAFSTDRLEPRWCGGDLLLQICADDPVVVAHTSRVLLKNVRSMTVQRWRQSGFRNARGADAGPAATMRNLMGQVDGTANLRDDADFDRHVWDDGAQQRWFAGGTVLVLRRIRAELDTWDELDRADKELTVGPPTRHRCAADRA